MATVLGILGTLVGAWATFTNSVTTNRLKTIETGLAERKDARDSLVADRDYLLRVTDKVFSSASSGDARQQEIARLLVDTLADGDVRDRLRAVLLATAAPKVRDQVAAAIAADRDFALQEAVDRAAVADDPMGRQAPVAASVTPSTRVILTGAGRYALDLFYCTGVTDTVAYQRRAIDLANALARDTATLGAVRVRPLPRAIVQRLVVGFGANQLRYAAADATLAKRIAKLLSQSDGSRVFAVSAAGTRARYLSVWVCSLGKPTLITGVVARG